MREHGLGGGDADALEGLGSPCVDRVLTLNEPNMLALASYIAGVFPHRAPAAAG